MTAKEILLKIKGVFDMPMPPAAPPAAPAPPAPPAVPTAKTYKLLDGTEISITQVGDMPAIGDTVMIGGVPAPAGPYTLEDGATITVGDAGVITVYTAMAAPPPPPPAPPAPVPPAVPVTLSAEEVAAMYAKFATGSTEERMGNLEIMVKALMDCNFGYEIRKGQEAAAIEAYKESLAPLQTSLEAATQKLQAASEKVESQQTIITKHEETIKGLFELVQLLVDAPTADPVTLTPSQKEKFERVSAKEERLKKMAAAMKEIKALS